MWEKIIEITKELTFGSAWTVRNLKERAFCLPFLLDLALICLLLNEKNAVSLNNMNVIVVLSFRCNM